MKTMIGEQLYPTGLNGDDNKMYLAYLDTILTQRQEAEYRALHPIEETEEDLAAHITNEDEDVFYDA
jgi:hypothetical protein